MSYQIYRPWRRFVQQYSFNEREIMAGAYQEVRDGRMGRNFSLENRDETWTAKFYVMDLGSGSYMIHMRPTLTYYNGATRTLTRPQSPSPSKRRSSDSW